MKGRPKRSRWLNASSLRHVEALVERQRRLEASRWRRPRRIRTATPDLSAG